MGIRGLTSFVKHIPEQAGVWTKTFLSSTKLVIDGNNLLYHLYSSSGLDTQCGGQYLEYYQLTRVFFLTLKKNDVEMVVVRDGVSGDDLTLSKKRESIREIIRKVQNFDTGKVVYPRFIDELFYMAAADSLVEIVMCDYEADEVAANLAKEKRCPVLSNDSDFYLFDIPMGVIPLPDVFQLQQNEGPLQCQSYHRDAFLHHIKLSAEFLPLLAVLVGNDFTNNDQLKPLHQYLRERNRALGTSFRSTTRENPITTVIAWLNQFRYVKLAEADAKSHASGFHNFGAILEKSKAKFSSFERLNCSVKMIDGNDFPDWVIESFKMMRFRKIAVRAACRGHIILYPQMEDIKRPTADTCSRPIRQVIYAILFKDLETAYSQRKVIEIGRADGDDNLEDYEVDISNSPNLCSLAEIESMSCKERLDILFSAAGCDFSKFHNLDSKLVLPAIALYYWCHLETHQVLDRAVYAAVFSFVTCYLKFNQLVKKATHCLDMPQLPMEEEHQQQELDLEVAHCLAEFQSILYYIMILNSVLDFPLPDFNVAAVFNGLMAHRAASEYHTYEDFLDASENSHLFADICKLLGRNQDGTDSTYV
ncbi:protein asteroid homolog 1-like [Corticium candelabrum]|uniref:protein asteroid homolog 1-like n=1 Tax=Corticium candelabrum TaxID=121492 RepID=UPI002E261125|nr:protein asteroid homolog 1-like [Corticium candelabrum]